MKILENEILLIATVGATKGIKGSLRLSAQDDLSFLKDNKVILYTTCYSIYTIDQISENEVRFKEIDNINDAKSLVNAKMYILKRDVESKDLLRAELINVPVYYKQKELGVVKSIIQTASYDILFILGNREYNIPFIDKVVKYIREERKLILRISGAQF